MSVADTSNKSFKLEIYHPPQVAWPNGSGQVSTLEITTKYNHIFFNRYVEFVPSESPDVSVSREDLKVTSKEGLKLCQADKQCNLFMRDLLQKGYKIASPQSIIKEK